MMPSWSRKNPTVPLQLNIVRYSNKRNSSWEDNRGKEQLARETKIINSKLLVQARAKNQWERTNRDFMNGNLKSASNTHPDHGERLGKLIQYTSHHMWAKDNVTDETGRAERERKGALCSRHGKSTYTCTTVCLLYLYIIFFILASLSTKILILAIIFQQWLSVKCRDWRQHRQVIFTGMTVSSSLTKEET